MKYLVVFLALTTCVHTLFAEADSKSSARELQLRAIREQWTFDFEVPPEKFATGLLHKDNERRDHRYAVLKHHAALPAHFDLTPRLTPVRNQGQCGSCWAFAIVAALENFPHAVPVDKPATTLSEQNLISCDANSMGCNGGYFTGLDYAASYGLSSRATFPYYGYQTICYAVPPDAKVTQWNYLGSADAQPTVEEIKTALVKSEAPVLTTMYADAAFQAYRSGIFNGCTQAATNHMVDIVGWDDTDEVWIVRNSWGSRWGEKGYFRIKWQDPWGRKCNGVGEQAAFISNAEFY